MPGKFSLFPGDGFPQVFTAASSRGPLCQSGIRPSGTELPHHGRGEESPASADVSDKASDQSGGWPWEIPDVPSASLAV